jgi:hypothetical protein
MSRDGSGTYNLPAGNPVVTHTLITSLWANTTLSDIATALTGSIAADGQTVPTQNLPMGALRHTNVGAATQFNQYARADQVQDGGLARLNTVTMAVQDVYTANLTFGSTTFTAGQLVTAVFPANNTGGAPTLNVNGSGAALLVRFDGSPVAADDVVAGKPYILLWTGTAWEMVGVEAIVNSFNNRTGDVTLNSTDVTDALTYTPVNRAGDTMTGPLVGTSVVLSGPITTTQDVLIADTSTSATPDFATGQTKVFTLSGGLSITALSGLDVGNIGRITFIATDAGTVTWPAGVKWPTPSETPPDFAAGSQKMAVVVLEYVGSSTYLANASVY